MPKMLSVFKDKPRLDFKDRDPYGLNSDILVGFDDILGEPKETHSAECTWESSSECFLCWRGLTYRILTMFCGMCLSCVWGIKFAIIAFQHIWIITPLLRSWTIYLNCFQRYWGTCVACCLSPICEISSVIFSRIFVYRR